MKVAALNIQHGGGKRVNKLTEYLFSIDADTLIFSEYRQNKNAPKLIRILSNNGYIYSAAASIQPKLNSVSIFSKKPFIPNTYKNLPEKYTRRVLSAQFENLTLYGVYFPGKLNKSYLYKFFLNSDHLPGNAPYTIIGDFNTGLHYIDEQGSTFYCADEFKALSNINLIDSWRSRNTEAREYSWFSNAGNGFRIDHAFSTPDADKRIKSIYYDHSTRESGITDHSAMLIQYDT